MRRLSLQRGAHVGGTHPNKKIKSATFWQIVKLLAVVQVSIKLNKE